MPQSSRIPARASRTQDSYPHAVPEADVDEDIASAYTTRLPTSTRRYYDTRGNQVIRQGNRQIVIHEQPPKRKVHWLLFVGIGMFTMVALWFLAQVGGSWWINQQLNATYQYPRMYQADEVVGHDDSSDNPTHFIFENLRGQVLIIELPGGDFTHAKIYRGPTLYADHADQIPVTAEFKDVNGDGKVDIILHIQDQRIVFLNTGSGFKEQ